MAHSGELGRRGNLVVLLLAHKDKAPELTYWFWCPGCEIAHRYESSRWTFNGRYDAPTFTPSLLVQGAKRCHLFLTDGRLQFLDDCQHALAGKTVALPEPPDWLASS